MKKKQSCCCVCGSSAFSVNGSRRPKNDKIAGWNRKRPSFTVPLRNGLLYRQKCGKSSKQIDISQRLRFPWLPQTLARALAYSLFGLMFLCKCCRRRRRRRRHCFALLQLEHCSIKLHYSRTAENLGFNAPFRFTLFPSFSFSFFSFFRCSRLAALIGELINICLQPLIWRKIAACVCECNSAWIN